MKAKKNKKLMRKKMKVLTPSYSFEFPGTLCAKAAGAPELLELRGLLLQREQWLLAFCGSSYPLLCFCMFRSAFPLDLLNENRLLNVLPPPRPVACKRWTSRNGMVVVEGGESGVWHRRKR